MGIAIELFLLFLAFCWAAGIGVPWTLLFVPAYLGLLTLKITPVGRRIKRNRAFMGCLTLFVFVAFGMGALAFRMLSDPVESIASWQLYNFLAGSILLKLFWSTVIGLAVGMEVLAVLLIPMGVMVAHGKYGDFEEYKSHKWQATRTAIYGFLGLSKGTWEVREGKLDVLNQPDGSLVRFGGPGELVVQQGHAVILERNGQVSRIVGCGPTWLQPFERVGMIVPLVTRTEQIVVSQVVTKDRVVIDEIELVVFHKVYSGEEQNQVVNGDMAYDPTILTTKVWSGSGSDWREAVKSISSRMLRDVAGGYTLEEIVPLTDQRRTEFARVLKDKIEEISKNALGVEIRALDFGAITFSNEIRARLLERWLAGWEQDIMATRAETEQHTQLTKAMARMETIKAISQGLKQLVGSGAEPEDIIALRYIDYLEQRAAGGGGFGEDDASTLIKLQGIEALRSLMHSSNGKT